MHMQNETQEKYGGLNGKKSQKEGAVNLVVK